MISLLSLSFLGGWDLLVFRLDGASAKNGKRSGDGKARSRDTTLPYRELSGEMTVN